MTVARSNRRRVLFFALLLMATDPAESRADNFPNHAAAPGSQSGDNTDPFSGIGQSPGADLFSGAATTRVPIEVPPGRLNMTPELALAYSSHAGRSPYGYGWSLALGRISRSTKFGVPVFDSPAQDDPVDTFVLELPSASGELRPTGGGRYRLRVEGAYLQIGFDSATNHWVVIDKTGTKFFFGKANGTDINGRTGPDTTDPARTFSWLLVRVEDTFGNAIDYKYLAKHATYESSPPGLPFEVSYGGVGNLSAQPHLFKVEFTWDPLDPADGQTTRSEGFDRYVQGRRLAKIRTRALVGSGSTVAREYTFIHTLPADNHGILRLDSVDLVAKGRDSAMDVVVPSTSFAYAPAVQLGFPTGTTRQQYAVTTASIVTGQFRDGGSNGDVPDWDMLDLNGDGIVDYVRPQHFDGGTKDVRLGVGATASNGEAFEAPIAWNWPAGRGHVRDVTRDHSNTYTRATLLDINGDGLVDYVSTYGGSCESSSSWCVWFNSAGGFAPTAATWVVPTGFGSIRLTDSDADLRRDTIDMDGDGLPDLVDSDGWSESTPHWQVFLNTGDGFETAALPWPAPKRRISMVVQNDGRAATRFGLVDMNGDGLPDLLDAQKEGEGQCDDCRTTRWQVWLNNGEGFDTTPMLWTVDGAAQGQSWLTGEYTRSHQSGDLSQTVVDLVDVTGDGLPDAVRGYRNADAQQGIPSGSCPGGVPVCTEGASNCCYMNVVLVNTGSSFAHPTPMRSWVASISDGKLPIRRTSSGDDPAFNQEFDLFDFDGDGLIDVVERSKVGGTEKWFLYRNPASPLQAGSGTSIEERTKPGALVSMMNGIGGETFVEYEPASLLGEQHCSIDGDLDGLTGRCSPYPTWVVGAIHAVDAFAQAPAVTTHYGYRGALFDGGEREPRGFGFVWEVAATGVTKARAYHQDTACAGRVASEHTFASAGAGCFEFDLTDASDPCNPITNVVETTTSDWDCAAALASIDGDDSTPVLLQGSTTTPSRRQSNGAVVPATDPYGKSLAKTTTYEYDDFGNEITRTITSDSTETVTVRTQYEPPSISTAGGVPTKYVVSRPARIYSHYGVTPSTPFQEKTIDYTADFAVKQVADCRQWSSSGECSSAVDTSYSGHVYGLPGTVSGPGRATTTYAYPSGITLVATATTHPDGLSSTLADYDYRIGKPVVTIGKNGQPTEIQYDGLGRLRKRWGPGFVKPGANELEVVYTSPDTDTGLRGSVKRLRPERLPEITFYDGFAREVATKRKVEVLTTAGTYQTVTRIEGLKLYDAAGRVTYGLMPYELTSDPVFDVLVPSTISSPPSRPYTELTYDDGDGGTGTVERMWLPNRLAERYDSTVPGVKATEDAEGLTSLEYLDALGRVVRRDQCAVMPSIRDGTACSGANLLARTEHVYDGLDRVIETRSIDVAAPNDPARAVIVETVAYDGLGNLTARLDANGNLWRYQYDRSSGLLIRTDTERDDVIRLRYDAAHRVTREVVTDGSDKKLKHTTKYRYYGADAAAPDRGRLEYVSFKGPKSGARQEKLYTYDIRGRVVTETMSVEGAHDDDSSYTFTYSYDQADRLVTTTYPSSLAGSPDVVESVYGADGNVAGLLVNGEVYASAGYDVQGHQTYVWYKNGVVDVAKYLTVAENSYLECLRTTRVAGVLPAAACSVSTGSDLRTVRYASRDLTGRILWIDDLLHSDVTKAWSNEHVVSYTPEGRIQSVTYSAGVTDNFYYDGLGRIRARNANTTYFYDWTYVANASTDRHQPYAMSRVQVGSATTNLDYDLNGNRVVRGSTVYSYTPTGGLAEVKSNSTALQQNAYGPDGSRIARYDDGDVPVHYYGGRFEIHGDELVRHFYLGDRRVASDRIVAPAGLSIGSAVVDLRPLAGTTALVRRLFGGSGRGDGGVGPHAVAVLVLLTGLALAARCGNQPGRLAALTATVYLLAILPAGSPLSAAWWVGTARHAAHAQEALGTTVFYHVDHLGSPQAISNDDNAVAELIRYDVLGKVRDTFQKSGTTVVTENPPDASTNLGYTGHEPDETTGLVYFGARHLDPDDGHFLSIDPARQYASPYVHGAYDPLNGRDPDGKWFDNAPYVDAFDAVVVATVRGVTDIAGDRVDTTVRSVTAVDSGDTGVVTRDVLESRTRAGASIWPGDSQATTTGPLSSNGIGSYGDPTIGSPPSMGISDLRIGDWLATHDGAAATAIAAVIDGNYGHYAQVIGGDGSRTVEVLSSSPDRGIYTAFNDDKAVGGRTWDVFRPDGIDSDKLRTFARDIATEGGLLQYAQSDNICSSVVARATAVAGGSYMPPGLGGAWWPNNLTDAAGPPVGRIDMPLERGPHSATMTDDLFDRRGP